MFLFNICHNVYLRSCAVRSNPNPGFWVDWQGFWGGGRRAPWFQLSVSGWRRMAWGPPPTNPDMYVLSRHMSNDKPNDKNNNRFVWTSFFYYYYHSYFCKTPLEHQSSPNHTLSNSSHSTFIYRNATRKTDHALQVGSVAACFAGVETDRQTSFGSILRTFLSRHQPLANYSSCFFSLFLSLSLNTTEKFANGFHRTGCPKRWRRRLLLVRGCASSASATPWRKATRAWAPYSTRTTKRCRRWSRWRFRTVK